MSNHKDTKTQRKAASKKRYLRPFFVSLCLCGSLVTAFAQTPKSPQRAFLDQYCVTCHNQRTKTAGVMFDTTDPADVSKHGDIWEKAVRKLRGGMMPPPGARRPDQPAIESFVGWLENSLDEVAAR